MKKLLILLQGKAQVGKSTIMSDFETSGYTQVCAGDLFKCVQAIGMAEFRKMIQSRGRDYTFDLIRDEKDSLLQKYEIMKQFPSSFGYKDIEAVRDESITLAESARLVYPDIWTKGVYMLNPDFTKAIGVAQDAIEREYLQVHAPDDLEFLDIQLHCTNQGEEDTRKFFTSDDIQDVNSLGFFSYHYKIEETHEIAAKIMKLSEALC